MRKNGPEHRFIATAMLASALLLTGCGDADRNDMDANSADTLAMGEQAGTLGQDSLGVGGVGGAQQGSTEQLNDAQIANVAITANMLDSATSASVVDRVDNADVRSFARKMVTEHGAMLDSLRAATASQNVMSASNNLSTMLEQQGAQELTQTGEALDRAYMEHQVMLHQLVLRSIDETLMPQVQDDNLRGLMERMRTSVAAHLQEAEQIRGRLGAAP